MAEVMDIPVEDVDRRRDKPSERRSKTSEESSPPPPPLPQVKRRDRNSRERREEREERPRRGDYYDRNRSPPPPSVGKAERERDYKRRISPSPPQYTHRDRRHSPPRRSPPPPSKQSRRDDGGYENRRGSPRDDRRFGFDPYDRMGGKPGYVDERSQGRYVNRQSDWSDSGNAGFGESMGFAQREGLMSYKQFIQELEDDVLPSEAEKRYEEYRSEYISTQKRTFFDLHKGEEWLRDKYHPTSLVAVIERRNENARSVARDFLLDLKSGSLDLGPGLTTSSSNKSGNDVNSEDEGDFGKRRRHTRGSTKENDLLSSAPKAHLISSEHRRIQTDIEQAQALVSKLDREKGIDDNVLCSADQDKHDSDKSCGGSMGPIIIIRGLTTIKGLEGVELLDTLITYLWRVHGVDYYGMSETSEPKGLRHVRAEGKNLDEANKSGSEWEKKLDSFWQTRLQRQDPLTVMTAKEKIEAAVEVLDSHVRKIRDEKYGWKYGCGAKGCTKLFHAAEFVHKHLRLKHADLVLELTSKLREDIFFQNYMNDASAPGGTPLMQQTFQRERIHRRRDNHSRDDRGPRREHDKVSRINGDDRYGRPDNSPSRDLQSGAGGNEGGNHEEHMYDYGTQSMHPTPFPSDIQPLPILMPVPGAGPLGPFVPAPPEVAMRMLREQGGPPYDGNTSLRSRNGRSGPQVGGPAPILALPPYRQDPRGLRSYQDLDAPEDEVTVIDYRSI